MWVASGGSGVVGSPLVLALGAFGAALVGAVSAWLVGRQQRSGRVDTSEASDLWAESKAIREDYRQQIADLRTELARMETRLADANTALATANTRLADANTRVEELRTEVLRLREMCGQTNEGVDLIRREIAAVRSDTPQGRSRRRSAEGGR